MTDNEWIEKFWVENGGKSNLKEDLSFYESSWDMLMPIVIKARDWWQNQEGEIMHESERLLEHVLPSLWVIDIKSTHRRIVKFIKWYYDTKQQEIKNK